MESEPFDVVWVENNDRRWAIYGCRGNWRSILKWSTKMSNIGRCLNMLAAALKQEEKCLAIYEEAFAVCMKSWGQRYSGHFEAL